LTRLDSAVGIGVDYSGSLAIDGIDTGDHDQLKYLGTVCHRIAWLNMRHTARPWTIPAWIPNPTMRRVYWSVTTSTQYVRKATDSHRSWLMLWRLSFAWPMKVGQEGPLLS